MTPLSLQEVEQLRRRLAALEDRVSNAESVLQQLRGELPSLRRELERAEAVAGLPPVLAPVSVSPLAPATPVCVAESVASEVRVPVLPPPAVFAPTLPGPVAPPPVVPPSASTADSSGGGLEMAVGTYWLVRVGVVMVLTGLVFLANYAWQNWVHALGAGARVGGLYVISGGLLGFGVWMERRGRTDGLRRYGQVVFGAGLAAVYFTTFAMHHIEPLRLVESPVAAGLLLLGWSGVMGWVADRRRSEVLGVMAFGLAYYTSAITRSGWFTLLSNGVLGVVLLVLVARHRWRILTVGGFFATYAGFWYWRVHGVAGEAALWSGDFPPVAMFLLGYWAIFSASVLVVRGRGATDEEWGLWLPANTVACLLSLMASQVGSTRPIGAFWLEAMALAAALALQSQVAAAWIQDRPAIVSGLRFQAVAVFTVGLVARFSGVTLGVLLAMESLALVLAGARSNARFWTFASGSLALVAAGIQIFDLERVDPRRSFVWVLIALLFGGNSWLLRRFAGRPSMVWIPSATLQSVLCGGLIWEGIRLSVPDSVHPVVFSTLSVLATLALRLRPLACLELGMVGVFFLVPADGMVILPLLEPGGRGSISVVWTSVSIGLGLVMAHQWCQVASLKAFGSLGQIVRVLNGVGMIWAGSQWAAAFGAPAQAPAWVALVGLGFFGVGLVFREPILMVLAQIPVLFAWRGCLYGLPDGRWTSWVVIMVMLVLSGVSGRLAGSGGLAPGWRRAGLLHRVLASVLGFCWFLQHLPAYCQGGVFATVGVGIVLLGVRFGTVWDVRTGFAWVGLGWLAFVWRRHGLSDPFQRWCDLLAACSPAVLFHLGRRVQRVPVLDVRVQRFLGIWAVAGVSLWVTRGAQDLSGGSFLLSVTWGLLALGFVGLGVALGESTYRRGGLALLGLAIARVVFVDVWELSTPYRILSFLVLGVVLLVLGFAYNRWEDRIRRWL